MEDDKEAALSVFWADLRELAEEHPWMWRWSSFQVRWYFRWQSVKWAARHPVEAWKERQAQRRVLKLWKNGK